MSKGWDSATLKKLKALVGKGLSTSEIGKRLGISKNAVVGKLNRLGWNMKAGGVNGANAKKVADKKPLAAKSAAKPAAKKSEAPKKGAATPRGTVKSGSGVVAKKLTNAKTSKAGGTAKISSKSLAVHQRIIQHSLELANLKPNQCRWPIGDPDSENFHFCGAPVFVGKPYCYEHCKQAYQFTPPKKK